MKLTVVTPYGISYQDDIEKAIIPTKSGVITVLPLHAQLVSVLASGEMVITKENGDHPFAISGGVMEVRADGNVYILADTAERADTIDIARAEAGRQRAQELLAQQQNALDVDFARLQAKIEKELARISVGKKYRK